ncbi:helix-turn-helix domain-containing protein [Noviherbaspirillum aerium]|uniref:helix-turn-helix domain-containing protein n=1 Tax=Noviherbaspirillum aerium TaxID=2588497 RepID=UPI00178C6952|nr:helix-turn-helix domain-containing protein [Noviherbaspirillum aerium]
MNEPGLNDQAMPGDTGKEQPILVSPGARLAACRQERGWTVEQVASQLNLAPRQVLALEADDYPSLPGMAIVRGFVRQYAKLLKIDAAPLLASLGGETMLAQEPIRPRQNLSTPFSDARLPSMNARSGLSAKWIVAAVAVVVIGAAVYALREGVDLAGMSRSASSQVKDGLSQIGTPSTPASQSATDAPATANTTDAASAPPEPINAQPPVDPAAGNGVNPPGQAAGTGQAGNGTNQQAANPNPSAPRQDGTATSQSPATSSAAAPPATPAATASPSAPAIASTPPSSTVAATASTAAPVNASNSLVIKARQDSWIEIKSAGSGKPAVSRLVKAGETETFEVTDPVTVVIGNASGVDATLRGNPVELKVPGNGNVARLTLK